MRDGKFDGRSSSESFAQLLFLISGTISIYRPSGKAHVVLINRILEKFPADKIIWETPNKSGQIYFIKLIGVNVNLGNIAPNDVIGIE